MGLRTLIPFLALTFIGCLSPVGATRGMMERLRAVGGPVGPDVLVMEYAVIEQSPGDPYIDQDLWSSLDEQAVALDRKAALDDNGYRVGIVGGLLPGKLQALLFSDRSCPDPHRVTTRSGNPKNISIGGAPVDCHFELKTDGESKPVNLQNAQCGLVLTPFRTPDGRIRIQLVPQAQHGQRGLTVQPAEGENWSLVGQRPTEKYTALSFEVSMSPQEYVVIGTRHDRENTIGGVTFLGKTNDKPVQRLLVIRARSQGDPAAPEWNWMKDPSKSPPLAYQASRTARGTSR
jgi:hypothetical protein